MGEQRRSAYCEYCQQQRLVVRERASHILHLLLTLLTFGLWAIIWLGVAVQIGGWRCTVCGLETRKGWPERVFHGLVYALLAMFGIAGAVMIFTAMYG